MEDELSVSIGMLPKGVSYVVHCERAAFGNDTWCDGPRRNTRLLHLSRVFKDRTSH
jgi:hypothetical protein